MLTEPLINLIIDKLNTLTGDNFVNLVVEHLQHRQNEYFDIEPGPPKGPDRSVDIVAMRRSPTEVPRKVAFQCKRYGESKSLDKTAVHEVVDAMLYAKADEGVLVSTKEPTVDAKERMDRWRQDGKPIDYKQWCGRGLVTNLVSTTPSVLVQRFPDLRLQLPTAHEFSYLCPSFEMVVASPAQPGIKADRFYDGHSPTWQNIAAHHDIDRDVYNKEAGLRDRVYELLESNSGSVSVVALLGVGGTGKTTLLRRLAYDVAAQGRMVMRLTADGRFINANLSRQIKDVVRVSNSPALVLFDNCAELVFERNLFEATLQELETDQPVVILLAEQPDRWNLALRRIPFLIKGDNYLDYTVHRLLPNEIDNLVDRILTYEADGTLSKIYCSLSREERLQLCEDTADRQLLIAMMQMRRGIGFRQIIQNEFNGVPVANAKEAYLLTCFFNTYGLSLPFDLLLRALELKSPIQVQELKEGVEGLLVENGLGLRARHEIIARVTAAYGLTTAASKKAALSTVISALDVTYETEQRMFMRLFTGQDSHRRFVKDMDRDTETVHSFYKEVRTAHASVGPNLFKYIATSQALAERMLGQVEKAKACLDEAIELDEKYAFAYRQYAWIEHGEGNWDQAGIRALKAAELAPDNFLCLYQAGRILSFNTTENFRKAKRYLKAALEKEPTDRAALKSWEDYLAAEEVLEQMQIFANELIPPDVFSELRPGLAFLRTVHGTHSRDFKKRLTGDLRNMEQQVRGDLADLYEKIEDVDDSNDPILAALIACNVGRLKYLDWYHKHADHNLDEIENLFRHSLDLNPKDPFTHCWFGTFLKEARKDYTGALAEYRTAIELGNSAKEWMHDHPLFLNNRALLIIDEVQEGKRHINALRKAQALLEKAVIRVGELHSDFAWPAHSLSLCKQLIAANPPTNAN